MSEQINSRPVAWLLSNKRAVSELGATVAELLDEMYDGIYHVENVTAVSFAGTRVEVPLFSSLATYDWANLTRLVVLAHDRCVRVEIGAEMRTYKSDGETYELPALVLSFTKRVRGGDWYHGHPTIEEAITTVRAGSSYRRPSTAPAESAT